MSCLAYWFWSVCLAELRRSTPDTLEELHETVTEYADSVTREEVIRNARDVTVRTRSCIAARAQGGPFE